LDAIIQEVFQNHTPHRKERCPPFTLVYQRLLSLGDPLKLV
jgi:hypothetical protein